MSGGITLAGKVLSREKKRGGENPSERRKDTIAEDPIEKGI